VFEGRRRTQGLVDKETVSAGLLLISVLRELGRDAEADALLASIKLEMPAGMLRLKAAGEEEGDEGMAHARAGANDGSDDEATTGSGGLGAAAAASS